jgi:hypothetical protein
MNAATLASLPVDSAYGQRLAPVGFRVTHSEAPPRLLSADSADARSHHSVLGAVVGGLAGGLLGFAMAYHDDNATAVCALPPGQTCKASVKNYGRNVSLGVVFGSLFGYFAGRSW